VNWSWYYIFVIPAKRETEATGHEFKASPGKVSKTLSQKQKQTNKKEWQCNFSNEHLSSK
jgi:hypothetical protein